jgi:hypothetical protein
MRIALASCGLAAIVSSVSLAGMVDTYTFTSKADWNDAPTDLGFVPTGWATDTATVRFTQPEVREASSIADFEMFDGGGRVDWSARSSALDGEVSQVNGALFSMPAGSSLVFTFTDNASTGGLLGVGGHFGFYDANGNRTSGRVLVKLSDGTAILRNFNSPDAFAGFWTTPGNATITELRITAIGTGSSTSYVGADSLMLGWMAPVPGPGSLVLLAAAGLMGSRRRR